MVSSIYYVRVRISQGLYQMILRSGPCQVLLVSHLEIFQLYQESQVHLFPNQDHLNLIEKTNNIALIKDEMNWVFGFQGQLVVLCLRIGERDSHIDLSIEILDTKSGDITPTPSSIIATSTQPSSARYSVLYPTPTGFVVVLQGFLQKIQSYLISRPMIWYMHKKKRQ